MQSWVNSSIQKVEEQIKPLEKELADLSKRCAALKAEQEESKERDREERRASLILARLESKLENLRHQLYNYQLLKQYIDKYVPTDAFETLALIIGLIVLTMFLKGFFEFWQETLVGSVVNKSLYDMRNYFFRKVIQQDLSQFSQSGTHRS